MMLSFSLGPLYKNNREQPPFQFSHRPKLNGVMEKFINTTVQVILKHHGGIHATKLIVKVSSEAWLLLCCSTHQISFIVLDWRDVYLKDILLYKTNPYISPSLLFYLGTSPTDYFRFPFFFISFYLYINN